MHGTTLHHTTKISGKDSVQEANMKPFSSIAAVVFGLVALMQLLRLALGWSVVINGVNIPLWASAVACLVAAGLAVMVWRETHP
jgi:hypothetical protein